MQGIADGGEVSEAAICGLYVQLTHTRFTFLAPSPVLGGGLGWGDAGAKENELLESICERFQ